MSLGVQADVTVDAGIIFSNVICSSERFRIHLILFEGQCTLTHVAVNVPEIASRLMLKVKTEHEHRKSGLKSI